MIQLLAACGPLATAFPALLSHSVEVEITVFAARNRGLRSNLVPRLTQAGVGELIQVQRLLEQAPEEAGRDVQELPLRSKKGGALSTRAAYVLARFGGTRSPHHRFIWGSCAPSRVKFFGWLLMQRRIHTRDVLLRKTIIKAAKAGCALCGAPLEMADHMVFQCPFARSLWASVGMNETLDGEGVSALHYVDASPVVGVSSPAAFVLLCCWHIWKHRNSMVFNDQAPSLARALACCREDVVLWRGRMKNDDDMGVWLAALRGPGARGNNVV